jgi:hypothetical protein
MEMVVSRLGLGKETDWASQAELDALEWRAVWATAM